MTAFEQLERLESVARAALAERTLEPLIHESNETEEIFWINPWLKAKERIFSAWWPAHPIEATGEVERFYAAINQHWAAFNPTQSLRLLSALRIAMEGLELIESNPREGSVSPMTRIFCRETKTRIQDALNDVV